jgi:outer membrane protein OmpA-like peptidoglycan-associated protein
MSRSILFFAALIGGLCVVPVSAPAQNPAASGDILCDLDPNCPKPVIERRHKPRGLRGVVIEGAPEQPPNSINLFINFAYNSAELTSDARITLDGLGTALRDPKLAPYSFVIAGHTDARGGAEFNQKLSERRAAAVREYMISQFGVAPERLSSKGYGKSQLLDPTNPEDGVNRRVQIINAGSSSPRK